MKRYVYYFETPGSGNTEKTIEIARQRAEQLNIDQIVVASTHGETARKVIDTFQDVNTKIVVVTISQAFDKEGWIMDDKTRKELQDRGARVVTTLHALGDDVNTAFVKEGTTVAFNQVVAETLRRFSQGMKVCVEITLMAAENGAINTDREAIAIAGTNEGADTAVVVKPSYARKFLDLQIREILAKPR